jgi:hypothetical protein
MLTFAMNGNLVAGEIQTQKETKIGKKEFQQQMQIL